MITMLKQQLLLWMLFFLCAITSSCAYHSTSSPPLLDVPVYSLSTRGAVGDLSSGYRATTARSTMNILTYASPVSSAPQRMWCISLFKGTLSHENFAREKRGILQLLRGPKHSSGTSSDDNDDELLQIREIEELIRALGGCSGHDIDKREICASLGYPWERLPQTIIDEEDDAWPDVLPSCLYYLKLQLVGELIDCGNHEVALCSVLDMVCNGNAEDSIGELGFLSTRALRRGSIISEMGRVI